MKKTLTFIFTIILVFAVLAGCNNINNDSIIESEIDLTDAFSFLKDNKTYVKVRKEEGYIGCAPGKLSQIFYSDNLIDINNVLNALNQKVQKVDDQMMTPGGSYLEYRLYTNETAYDLVRITNDLIIYNESYYKLKKFYDVKFIDESKQIYSFANLDEVGKVYQDNEYKKDFDNINKLEFTETEPNSLKEVLTIDCLGFKIYVLNNDEFYIIDPYSENNYKYYKVIGDINFSSIM